MKTRQFGFAATVIGLGAIAFSVACADQPKPKCVTGRGEFAARYTYKSGPDFCKARKGELLGVQSYNERTENGAPNLDRIPIAIQSVGLAQNAAHGDGDPDPNHHLYATGIFTTGEPGDDNFCRVNMTGIAEQVLPKVDETEAEIDEETKECAAPKQPEIPALNVKYEWSDVVFYVTAAATGTQFKGSLKYTQNGEVCEFDVHAMYPSVGCGDPVPAASDPTCRVTTPNQVTCSPQAPPDIVHGLPVGTSINPDFPTSCEPFDDVVVHDTVPTQFVCLPPAGKFPALR